VKSGQEGPAFQLDWTDEEGVERGQLLTGPHAEEAGRRGFAALATQDLVVQLIDRVTGEELERHPRPDGA
jgi:hypothetical protein